MDRPEIPLTPTVSDAGDGPERSPTRWRRLIGASMAIGAALGLAIGLAVVVR